MNFKLRILKDISTNSFKDTTQLKNTLWYMLPVVVSNVLPVVTLPIFTSIISVADYGVYALTMVYAVFCNGLSNFGLTAGYERNFFENSETRKRAGLLFATLTFVITTFIIFAVFTFIFRSTLSEIIIGSKTYGNMLFLSYSGAGVMSLKTYFLTYLKNSENPKSFVWSTVGESILSTSISLYFVAYLRIGVSGLIWGQLIASLIIFFVLCIKFLRMIPFSLDFLALKHSLNLSLPLTPKIFFGVIGTEFDKYMIGLIGTVGGVGVYNLGQKIGNIGFTFMTAIQNVFAPQVYQRMFTLKEKGGESIGRYLTPFLYISISGSLFIALFSEELIRLLTPESFHGAIDVVCILSLLYGTYFFGKQPQLIYAKKTSLTSGLSLLGIFLNIGINIPFIKIWGMIGAAWGTLCAGLITGVISFYFSQKYYRIQWEFNKLIMIFGLFFTCTIGTMLLRHYMVVYELRLVIKLLCLGFFVFLGNYIGVLSKENLLVVKHIIFSRSKKLEIS